MELSKHWNDITAILQQGKKTNKHFAIATVDEQGNPHVTPIGHVFFRDDMTGYYFDAYSKAMPQNFQGNKKICLMAVNSSSLFWLKSLIKGEFESAPAVRVYGEVGEPRQATNAELEEYRKSIRITRFFKGHKLLWQNLDRVRDIKFTDFKPAEYPVMCEQLWRR